MVRKRGTETYGADVRLLERVSSHVNHQHVRRPAHAKRERERLPSYAQNQLWNEWNEWHEWHAWNAWNAEIAYDYECQLWNALCNAEIVELWSSGMRGISLEGLADCNSASHHQHQ